MLLNLKATHFRNLSELNLEPSQRFNLIYGVNGSGKTSILEAIHFLSVGRSFRSHLANRMIHHEEQGFAIFGMINGEDNTHIPVGIEKSNQSKLRMKLGNTPQPSIASLAKILPTQLINPESCNLLQASLRKRREFLDWGVFHVEHSFFSLWQRFQRVLKQRNSALQQGVPLGQIKAWDYEFVSTAYELAKLREIYIQRLFPVVAELLQQLLNLHNITINYNQGWDKQADLLEVLHASYARDAAVGYTKVGPQRADIEIRVNNVPVQDELSRGEQKLLVCVLRLAQGMLLRQLTGKHCTYLIDDLAAELDLSNRQLLISVLAKLKAQVFITATEATALEGLSDYPATKLFHVEHGQIRFG